MGMNGKIRTEDSVKNGFRDNVRLSLTPPLTTFATLSVFPLPLKRREKGKPGMTGVWKRMTGVIVWKRMVIVVLTVLLLIGLVACGREREAEITPADVVDYTLDTLKEKSPEEIAVPVGIGYEYMDDVLAQIAEKALDFEYEIGESVVRGDRADVEVTIKTYPFGAVFADTMDDFLTNIAEEIAAEEKKKAEAEAGETTDAAISAAEETEALEIFEDDVESEAHNSLFTEKFRAQMSKVKPNFTKKVTFTLLRNSDGQWVIDALSAGSEVVDAIYGGMIQTAAEFDQKTVDEIFIRSYTAAFMEEDVQTDAEGA
jgi:hypothetical protein